MDKETRSGSTQRSEHTSSCLQPPDVLTVCSRNVAATPRYCNGEPGPGVPVTPPRSHTSRSSSCCVCLPSGACRPDPDCQTWESIRSKYAGAAGGAFYGCCGGWHAVENICTALGKQNTGFGSPMRGLRSAGTRKWRKVAEKKLLLKSAAPLFPLMNFISIHESDLAASLAVTFEVWPSLCRLYIIHKFHFFNEKNSILMHL